jgi:hypothetical protein
MNNRALSLSSVTNEVSCLSDDGLTSIFDTYYCQLDGLRESEREREREIQIGSKGLQAAIAIRGLTIYIFDNFYVNLKNHK